MKAYFVHFVYYISHGPDGQEKKEERLPINAEVGKYHGAKVIIERVKTAIRDELHLSADTDIDIIAIYPL